MFVALLISPVKAIIVLVFLVVLQQIEGNVLVPRIQGDAIGLSPLTVILAILAGTALAGPIGGLLAVPFAAIIQVSDSGPRDCAVYPGNGGFATALRNRIATDSAGADSNRADNAQPAPNVFRQVREPPAIIRYHPPRPQPEADSGEGDD